MKKVLCCVFLFVALANGVTAQSSLIAHGSDKGLYLDHKVVAKEGMYSIGRLYNVSPKTIAAFNNVDMNKGLNIGQVIRIPLTDTNFTQKTKTGAPVYYVPGPGEGLMKISNAARKVSLASLRSWNGLTSDNVQAGSKVIVGFLESKDMAAVASTPPLPEVVKPVIEQKKPVQDQSIVVAEPVKQVALEKKPEINPEIKPETKPETKPEVKQEPVQTDPVVASKVVKEESRSLPSATDASVSGQGYFKSAFEQQSRQVSSNKNETVTAGIFKTTSGWTDDKYYLLIDNVDPGTIIKVVNPTDNKAVYAKVLGQMSGIRQNEGLTVRISSAAASALGVTDTDKFILQVNY